jgi:rhodanese-related sulfurtransferase
LLHLPLSRLEQAEPALCDDVAAILHCASGARTGRNAARLAARAWSGAAVVVEGGMAALRQAGLERAEDRGAPLR